MEALWSLEDKFKLSTKKAVALFACTSLLVISICVIVAVLRRKRRSSRRHHQEPLCKGTAAAWAEPPVQVGRRSVTKALMGKLRWSGRFRKWEDQSLRGSQREAPTPLLVKRDVNVEAGWQSHNSTSAVWQRPILMGEKCELPRFSGLILYDQRGLPLHDQCEDQGIHIHYVQEKTPPVLRTTLRDLL